MVDSVHELLELSWKTNKRPLTWMEIEAKVSQYDIKSKCAAHRELKTLISHKMCEQQSVKVQGKEIVFYRPLK